MYQSFLYILWHFVAVNQGLFLCICKPAKLCYNIMLYRAKVRAA